MSEADNPVAEAETAEATAGAVETAGTSGSGMGLRLGIMLGIFVVLAAAIMGYKYYLQSQVPAGDPNYVKQQATDEEMGSTDGGALVAPGI